MYKIVLNGIHIKELFVDGISPTIPYEAIPISNEDGELVASALRHDLYDYENGKLKINKEVEEALAVEKDKRNKKKDVEVTLKSALARLILGQPMTPQDIDAATEYLAE